MSDKEPRKGFTVFWTKKEIEAGWPDIVTEWRKVHRFTEMVKDAVAVYLDLRAGNTDELLKHFPFVLAAIQQQETIAPTTAPQKMNVGFIPMPNIEDDNNELAVAESAQQTDVSNMMTNVLNMMNS